MSTEKPMPRRAAQAHSVSLVHSPRDGTPALSPRHALAADQPDQKLHSKPNVASPGSGESSNADKWFDKSNNHAFENSPGFVDGSPPFFQHIITPPEHHHRPGTPHSDPIHRPSKIVRRASSTEEYRGVIDDLTIENKTLRKRLRKFEGLQRLNIRSQKLFEVRVHGMSASKKRELEGLLTTFAIGLQNQDPTQVRPGAMPQVATSSSMTSSQPFADSAYVSGDVSAQGSNSAKDKPRQVFSQARRQNVQSYLHNVSQGRLYRPAPEMTDRAKRKLVVRRLEGIFAGKGAALGGHQQHVQQQEISDSAAKDDHAAATTAGQVPAAQGTREAHIMNRPPQTQPPDSSNTSKEGIKRRDFAQDGAEQRPTRPLDLDPQRAQIPADNIHYIRHLGFSPPDVTSNSTPKEDRGWIYLNILTNMAQLHTLNVSLAFVQQALKSHSKQFELSEDGRKVRWTGGDKLPETSESGLEDKSPRKAMIRANSFKNGRSAVSNNDLTERLSYTPLFQHRSSDDTDTSSIEEDDDDANGTSHQPGASSTNTNPLKRKRGSDTGPIIFYQNASFCTDLCGDHDDAIIPYAEIFYHCAIDKPLGKRRRKASESRPESRGLLSDALQLPDSVYFKDLKVNKTIDLDIQPMAVDGDQDVHMPVKLEASGIGGVRPADNFTINVQTKQQRLDSAISNDEIRPPVVPGFITRILESRKTAKRTTFQQEMTVSNQEAMHPSDLPPASCYLSAGDTPDDEEDKDDMSISPSEISSTDAPAAAPLPIEMYCASSNESDDGKTGPDSASVRSDDDGSVDLLATAREIDPEAIRAKEREYDAEMAERLADDIPAGSSAATAGGGSGFNTPALPETWRQHSRG